ncbi:MAG TPA: hypothetical protein VII82_01730 [Polyangiaceae bacterium]
MSEAACPFCGTAFADAFRASPRPKGPGARLTRAALVAFGTLGTGSLAVLPACSSSSSAAPTGGGETDDSGGTGMPLYGTAPIGEDATPGTNDAGTDAGGNGGSDAEVGNPMPLYGAPAMGLDSGDEIKDASEDHPTFVALYGAAPH